MAASETLEDGMLAALAVAVKGLTAAQEDLVPQELQDQILEVTQQELAGRQDLYLAAPPKDP
jgi:hypothetical protein